MIVINKKTQHCIHKYMFYLDFDIVYRMHCHATNATNYTIVCNITAKNEKWSHVLVLWDCSNIMMIGFLIWTKMMYKACQIFMSSVCFKNCIFLCLYRILNSRRINMIAINRKTQYFIHKVHIKVYLDFAHVKRPHIFGKIRNILTKSIGSAISYNYSVMFVCSSVQCILRFPALSHTRMDYIVNPN